MATPDEKIKLAKIHRSIIKSILNNDVTEFDKVLKDNSNINMSFQSSGKMTPLHTAAAQGRREMCERLLSMKANIEAKNALGFTPLISAAINGHEGVVSTLLKSGADKNVTTAKGETATILASQRGFNNVVGILN
jgi:ankyrin repeat protein